MSWLRMGTAPLSRLKEMMVSHTGLNFSHLIAAGPASLIVRPLVRLAAVLPLAIAVAPTGLALLTSFIPATETTAI